MTLREEVVNVGGFVVAVHVYQVTTCGRSCARIELRVVGDTDECCVDAQSGDEALRLLPVVLAAFSDSAGRRQRERQSARLVRC
jgi:hypothetical protein